MNKPNIDIDVETAPKVPARKSSQAGQAFASRQSAGNQQPKVKSNSATPTNVNCLRLIPSSQSSEQLVQQQQLVPMSARPNKPPPPPPPPRSPDTRLSRASRVVVNLQDSPDENDGKLLSPVRMRTVHTPRDIWSPATSTASSDLQSSSSTNLKATLERLPPGARRRVLELCKQNMDNANAADDDDSDMNIEFADKELARDGSSSTTNINNLSAPSTTINSIELRSNKACSSESSNHELLSPTTANSQQQQLQLQQATALEKKYVDYRKDDESAINKFNCRSSTFNNSGKLIKDVAMLSQQNEHFPPPPPIIESDLPLRQLPFETSNLAAENNTCDAEKLKDFKKEELKLRSNSIACSVINQNSQQTAKSERDLRRKSMFTTAVLKSDSISKQQTQHQAISNANNDLSRESNNKNNNINSNSEGIVNCNKRVREAKRKDEGFAQQTTAHQASEAQKFWTLPNRSTTNGTKAAEIYDEQESRVERSNSRGQGVSKMKAACSAAAVDANYSRGLHQEQQQSDSRTMPTRKSRAKLATEEAKSTFLQDSRGMSASLPRTYSNLPKTKTTITKLATLEANEQDSRQHLKESCKSYVKYSCVVEDELTRHYVSESIKETSADEHGCKSNADFLSSQSSKVAGYDTKQWDEAEFKQQQQKHQPESKPLDPCFNITFNNNSSTQETQPTNQASKQTDVDLSNQNQLRKGNLFSDQQKTDWFKKMYEEMHKSTPERHILDSANAIGLNTSEFKVKLKSPKNG